jgi:hypothetical protein
VDIFDKITKFKLILIAIASPPNYLFILANRIQRTLLRIEGDAPDNRLVPCEHLLLLEIIIILGPDSDGVIVACTDDG